MTTALTNPETNTTIPVFVHSRFVQHGEEWATVNKGAAKTPMTFNVRAELLRGLA
jgi:hypothetical protein